MAKRAWSRAFLSIALSAVALSCAPSPVEQSTESVAQAVGPAENWQGVDMGNPGATGSESCSGTTCTVTGAGTGIGATDSLHFTYTTLTGDFTLVARIASFTGGAGSSVGLMVRQDTTATSPEGSVFFQPAFPGGTAPYVNNVMFHAPAGRYPAKPGELPAATFFRNFTAMATPLYLKLVRLGADFAVYKSSNGTIWSQIGSNQSGGEFSATGTIYVGFAVASGSTSTVQATFDNVSLRKTGALNYQSSWVGNTLTKDSTGYVTGTSTALAVTPDGTAIINGYSAEGGEPAKIYKNGAVVRTIPTGGLAYEGSVATDGSLIYLYNSFNDTRHAGIYRTSVTGSTALVPISFANPLMSGSPVGSCQVSGMALGNGELYVSNATAGTVLVANPLQPMYFVEGNAFNTVSTQPINVSAVTNPAPQAVYQSSRESDWLSYTLPGFTPGAAYSVRLHFAVLSPTAHAGSYVGSLSVGGQNGVQSVPSFDPYVQAGNAVQKASTVTFTNVVPYPSGQIGITLQITSSPTIFINGIEVLNASGSAVFQLNAGGGNTGTWKSDVYELVDRKFQNLTRPGPIAVDKRGNLWIVQEGPAFPVTGKVTATPGLAAIRLYDKNRNYLNKQVTDLINPTAIAYDSTLDRLLVAEAGPAQNIRIYTGLTTTPRCTSTFGQSVFSSPPGLVNAPGAGGHARFYSPTGVGIDQSGNIYVASYVDNAGEDLRAFAPGGSLLWSLAALDFTNSGDFLPSATNGISPDIYTPTKHYALNLSSVGNEWSLYSYLWNPFVYGANPRPNNSSSVVRSLGPQHETVVYTGGQGVVGFLGIYRLSTASGGEQLVPAGTYDGVTLWLDGGSGDGIQQSTENSTGTPFGFQSFDIDSAGNIYLIGTNSVRKLNFLGIDPTNQVPRYSVASGNFSDRVLPPPFNAGATLTRVKYDASGDSLYVLGATNFTAPNDGNHEYSSVLARYDGWASGPLETVFTTTLPTPATDTNFMFSKPYPFGLNFNYEGMDVVPYTFSDGRVFVSEVWGPVHVFDAFSGQQLTVLAPGPEVDGDNAWEDSAMGIRAGYNETYGEYQVITENSGFRSKENFFRWNGSTDPTACNALGNGAVAEAVVSHASAIPAGTGGTIVNGLYHASSADSYQFTTVPNGALLRDTLLVSGNTIQTSVHEWAADGTQNFTIQTSGSTISAATETCSNAFDPGGWRFSSFTATPTQLTLYSSTDRYSITFSRVP